MTYRVCFHNEDKRAYACYDIDEISKLDPYIEQETKPEGEITDYILENGKIKYSEDPAKASRLIKQEVAQLKSNLSQSDYVMAKAVEELIACDSIVDIVKVLKQYREDYKQAIADRKTWRERIKELEN